MSMNPVEKFPTAELHSLREDLRQSGLDHWQAAELLSVFLGIRGYGVSSDEARTAATRLEADGCTVPRIQAELESLAFCYVEPAPATPQPVSCCRR